MIFKMGAQIVAVDATDALKNLCDKWLVLPNPEFIKKEKMGLWTGRTPRELYLYKQIGNHIVMPVGCVKWLTRAFPDAYWEISTATGEPYDYGSSIVPYDYQESAVSAAVERGGGIIVAPCGAGKTQIGLEIVARLGVRTLWLTHTQDLLNQSLARAKSVFSSVGGYGKITGGKIEIGQGLTFATVQTMAKQDLREYQDVWGCVVVDECHHCVGAPTKTMQFYKVLSSLAAEHKFGLTATPKRADGMETAMYSLLGGIAYEVPREAVKDTTCPVNVKTIYTGWIPSDAAFCGDGTVDYMGLISDLTRDRDRLALVVRTILQLPAGQPVLVLGSRVDYLKELQHRVSSASYVCQCISGAGTSKAAKAERKEALGALNRGDIDCLFATYQLAKEGLDCPNLRYVVFATPEKDPTTVQQAAGRVGRKADNKDYGTVIDFIDAFGMYQGWAKKRKTIYKKLGYTMED